MDFCVLALFDPFLTVVYSEQKEMGTIYQMGYMLVATAILNAVIDFQFFGFDMMSYNFLNLVIFSNSSLLSCHIITIMKTQINLKWH